MQRDDTALLLDMVLAARDAVHFAEGLTFDQFEESRLHQNAIVKAIETVGEAAGRFSIEFLEAHFEIPWTQVFGMRHRLVHDYLKSTWRVFGRPFNVTFRL